MIEIFLFAKILLINHPFKNEIHLKKKKAVLFNGNFKNRFRGTVFKNISV